MSSSITRTHEFTHVQGKYGTYDITDRDELLAYVDRENIPLQKANEHQYYIDHQRGGAIVLPNGDRKKVSFIAFYDANSLEKVEYRNKATRRIEEIVRTNIHTGEKLKLITRVFLENLSAIENDANEHHHGNWANFYVINTTLRQLRAYNSDDEDKPRSRSNGYLVKVPDSVWDDIDKKWLQPDGQPSQNPSLDGEKVEKVPAPPSRKGKEHVTEEGDEEVPLTRRAHDRTDPTRDNLEPIAKKETRSLWQMSVDEQENLSPEEKKRLGVQKRELPGKWKSPKEMLLTRKKEMIVPPEEDLPDEGSSTSKTTDISTIDFDQFCKYD